ncbi:hypothetical protein PHLCEN_2v10604 [Hermanssonia centrifuga]|uniref:4'-phosphopantetheinyl transferase domain-containing protein n=1 Tax=Hermanssonia centrifuga TaxID=98765 RepID=A0A2R6NMU9_9APHY|nr:hypothetical protein PHLCEN_2v10604 [Hermanssonia centrifuga]
MGIIGIGVDIVHLPRISSLISRRGPQRLANRILSKRELTDWYKLPSHDLTRLSQFLAVRWSLKEAAYKAIYPSARPTWKDFTYHAVDHDGNHKPFLVFHPPEKKIPIGNIHSSVSHDGDYIFTTVLVEDVIP